MFKYFCVYIILSILGFQVSPIFYSFHLLDVINRFPTLGNVIQSVRLKLDQLLMTGMLGIIIIYIFSVFGFTFLFEMYYDEAINRDIGSKRGESTCTTMFHCFCSTVNYGLRMGGGIGEVLAPQSYATKTEYYLRVVFDLSFFLIVVIILLNIIFGIIIDTFAELRDLRRYKEDDMKNKCFICNIERYQFDRYTDEGFERHIVQDHNLWKYLFYIVHLLAKDKTDYDGTESYIWKQYENDLISWFPLHKSIALNDGKQEKETEDEKINQKIQSIEKSLYELEKIMQG